MSRFAKGYTQLTDMGEQDAAFAMAHSLRQILGGLIGGQGYKPIAEGQNTSASQRFDIRLHL